MKKLLLAAIVAVFLIGAGCISFNSSSPATLGVYRSPDKGEHWQEVNSFPTSAGVKSISQIKVYRLFLDPVDHNAIYMASRGQGLYYSYDRGGSWQIAAALANRFIYSVAIDPTDKCVIYATDGNSIFKSVDCNRTYVSVYAGQGESLSSLAIDSTNHEIVYAAGGSGSVFQSLNAGASWRTVKNFSGAALRDIQTDPATPNRIYVASDLGGLSRSDDGGATWVSESKGLQNFSEALTFYRLYLDPSQKDSVYWLSQYGILHSTDAGQTWNEVKLVTSPGSVNIYTFALNPKNPKELYYTATVFPSQNQTGNSKLYKSLDGGTTWFNRKLPSSAVPVSLIVHPDDPNTLFTAFTTVP